MAVKHAILVGVGGQGAILTAKVLVSGLMKAGYDVKMSEVHGMSQRGGSVSTQVHWGEKVYSPLIGPGAADVLVAFEKMEAVRYATTTTSRPPPRSRRAWPSIPRAASRPCRRTSNATRSTRRRSPKSWATPNA